jgi:hypothetical protein
LQPGRPVALGGPGGPPDFHDVEPVFSTGSGVVCVVVGWGLGVTVTTTGDKVLPPMMVVLPPSVSVTGGSSSVCESQM